MSKEINDGGPAFARPASRDPSEFHQPEYYPATEGMSLRDYFAAKAMDVVWLNIPEDVNRQDALKYLGESAYEMADALLKARKEQ